MGRTQEEEDNMKHLGFFGIFYRSFETIFSWKKIFTQITLAFILPLLFVFLLHFGLTLHIIRSAVDESSQYSSSSYSDSNNIQDSVDEISQKMLYLVLLTVACIVFLIFFSPLSTASFVFTVTSIYTDLEVGFRHILKGTRKVWKRLFVTCMLIPIMLVTYIGIGKGVEFIISRAFGGSVFGSVVMFLMLILYAWGYFYLSFVFQLASVVTVLENIYAFKALRKSKILANGNKFVGILIAFVQHMIFGGLYVLYFFYVGCGIKDCRLVLVGRVMIGILCGILLLMCGLVFSVTQTLLYLVCKSYHQEAIDTIRLSKILGAYTGETAVVHPKSGDDGYPQP